MINKNLSPYFIDAVIPAVFIALLCWFHGCDCIWLNTSLFSMSLSFAMLAFINANMLLSPAWIKLVYILECLGSIVLYFVLEPVIYDSSWKMLMIVSFSLLLSFVLLSKLHNKRINEDLQSSIVIITFLTLCICVLLIVLKIDQAETPQIGSSSSIITIATFVVAYLSLILSISGALIKSELERHRHIITRQNLFADNVFKVADRIRHRLDALPNAWRGENVSLEDFCSAIRECIPDLQFLGGLLFPETPTTFWESEDKSHPRALISRSTAPDYYQLLRSTLHDAEKELLRNSLDGQLFTSEEICLLGILINSESPKTPNRIEAESVRKECPRIMIKHF